MHDSEFMKAVLFLGMGAALLGAAVILSRTAGRGAASEPRRGRIPFLHGRPVLTGFLGIVVAVAIYVVGMLILHASLAVAWPGLVGLVIGIPFVDWVTERERRKAQSRAQAG